MSQGSIGDPAGDLSSELIDPAENGWPSTSSTIDVIMYLGSGERGSPQGRLTMNRVFLRTHREWIEFIIVTVVLLLVMVVTISGLDLRTVS
jgi:hypothetical protein